jgi:hypothetical protein
VIVLIVRHRRALGFFPMQCSRYEQLAKTISETKSNYFSEPLATLDSRLLYCQRHQARRRKNIEVLWHFLVLKQRSGSTTSAVILIQGFASKDTERMLLGTALVDYVRKSPIPVLWALQAPGSTKFAPTTTVQLLKNLAMHVLRSRGSTVEDQISPELNATRIASTSTTEHWTGIIKHALLGMPIAYIVVDLNLLDQADDLCTCIMRLIEICKPIKLKIAIISRRRLPRVDYESSSTAVLDADQSMSSGPRAFVGQTRYRPGASMGRGGGRGALAFRACLT